MSTQQQAAQLYQEAQATAAEAWQGAATNATAYMHPRTVEVVAPVTDYDHDPLDGIPVAVQVLMLCLHFVKWLGGLCILAVGLALALAGTYFGVAGQDGRWLLAALVGWLMLALLWRAVRGEK